MSTFKLTDVYDMAVRIMTTLSSVSTAASAVLPSRQVVSTGGAVYDCEMVVCSVIKSQMGWPDTGGSSGGSSFADGSHTYPMQGNISIWTCTYELAIVRCAEERFEGKQPPKPEWLAADLLAASGDYALLIETQEQMIKSLGTPIPDGAVSFLQPQGQLIATRLQFTLPVWPEVYIV